ncbi:hypothetical protein ABEW81_11135 [Priestia megaterium]
MTVQEIYLDAIMEDHYSLRLLIEYLVIERQAISFESHQDKLTHYMQPKFWGRMNEYLAEYEKKTNQSLQRG